MTQQIVFALFNGFATGMTIFLVAAGVTLIFGILKIINFSHGAFFMLGAYLAYSIVGTQVSSVPMLIFASVAAGLVVGLFGYVVDVLVLRKIRGYDEHYVLIGTFAILLMVNGVVKVIWGVDFHGVSPPASLSGAFRVAGVVIPSYSIFVIVVGVLAFLALDFALHRMWIGKVLRSLVSDSWMIGLLGYNVVAYYLFTVMLAFFMAGAAGALLLPNQSLAPTLSDAYLMLGFVCCIIGGLGNVRGAFVAAILLGVVENISTVLLNGVPGLTVYVAMVLTLLFRPQGIFAAAGPQFTAPPGDGWLAPRAPKPSATVAAAAEARIPKQTSISDLRLSLRPRPFLLPIVSAVICVAALTLPFWANPGIQFLAGRTAIDAIFALSWAFMFSIAGVVSFGHAAFFALGGYAVGVFLKFMPGVPFLLGLAVTAVFAALIAGVVGLMTLKRASGIYLAILTMSLAEILRMLIGQSNFLGRDDGLSSIPRPKIGLGFTTIDLTHDTAYYYFILFMTVVCVAPLWWLTHGRFGRVLQAMRQDAERTVFIGVDISRYRLAAFMIGAAVAAVAGGLYAPWTQIATPELGNLHASVVPVLNTLLGGAHAFWGPIVGTIAFAFVNFSTRTLVGVSEIVIGGTLLAIVLVAPLGIVGFLEKVDGWIRPGRRQSGGH